jgi:predicted AlkP superfamily pyrophosphatase or phosphodiesterase
MLPADPEAACPGTPGTLAGMASVALVMIDGLAAGAFARRRADLPHLHALAEEGLLARDVAADLPATSLPGRTGLLTGVGPERHGVYGNYLLDGDGARYANPDDVRVATLPRRAGQAGLDVAVLGYGMVRPEDARTFRHPWWAGEMLQRARDLAPVPADEGWLRTARHEDASGRLARLAEAGLPDRLPDPYDGDRSTYLLAGAEGDRAMIRWTAGVLAQDPPPDLVVTEILLPDSVQHVAGPDHPFSVWSLAYADGLIGTLRDELRRAGREDDVTLVVTSDHGHGPVREALRPDVLLPGTALATEGSILHVAAPDDRARRDVEARLAEHGVVHLPGAHLPADVRPRVAAFVAPDGLVFERSTTQDRAPRGPARSRSAHGFRPGHPDDRRVLIARGPGVASGRLDVAEAQDVEATVARLLGLPPAGPGRPLAAV